MSDIQIESPTWQAIMTDSRLANARRRLSFHEIRLIIRHAQGAQATEDATPEPTDAGHAQGAIEAAIKAICRERCAEHGDPPCYELDGSGPTDNPFKWPGDCADGEGVSCGMLASLAIGTRCSICHTSAPEAFAAECNRPECPHRPTDPAGVSEMAEAAAREALFGVELARTGIVTPANGARPYSYVTFAGARIEFQQADAEVRYQAGTPIYDAATDKAAEQCGRINDLLFDVAKRAAVAALRTPPVLEVAKEALEPFADFADPRGAIPASLVLTAGSSIAKRQLTMGDCYNARAALKAIGAGQ